MKLTLSFGVKINFILGLGLAILVGVGVLSWRSIQELVDTGRDESSTLSALAQIEVVSGAVRGVVAAQRSYLITHRDSDRRSYRYARDRVLAEIGRHIAYAQTPARARRAGVQHADPGVVDHVLTPPGAPRSATRACSWKSTSMAMSIAAIAIAASCWPAASPTMPRSATSRTSPRAPASKAPSKISIGHPSCRAYIGRHDRSRFAIH